MRPLGRELTGQYDLNIKKYQFIRSNYYLDTNKGKFVLRKVDLSKDQIAFCYEVDMQLEKNQFHLMSGIYPTKKKLPYAVFGEEIYVMQSYSPSDETDFKNEEDLEGIIRTLARFHNAAVGIESKVRNLNTIKIKNIFEYYSKRQIENNKLKKSMLGLTQKSNFELMFLEECEIYRNLEQLALSSINKDLAERLISKVTETKSVAHKDFTYHTVNKTEEGQYMIEQLDSCNYDIQVIDLAQILAKMMQKNEWDKDLLYKLINTYNNERSLSKDELQMLKFMMIYPEKYNSICLKYINSKRRWNYSMFEQKWQSMMAYKDKQIEAAKMIELW